eukprot:10932444-Karenia_brevis.AAC.1
MEERSIKERRGLARLAGKVWHQRIGTRVGWQIFQMLCPWGNWTPGFVGRMGLSARMGATG